MKIGHTKINFKNPFEVITNSLPYSYDHVIFDFMDIGQFSLRMSGGDFTAEYSMQYDCTSPDEKRTAKLPDTTVKVWTFSQTKASFLIHCNDQIAANISFDEGVTHCERRWGDDFSTIRFRYLKDSASDYYRQKQQSGLYQIVCFKYVRDNIRAFWPWDES